MKTFLRRAARKANCPPRVQRLVKCFNDEVAFHTLFVQPRLHEGVRARAHSA